MASSIVDYIYICNMALGACGNTQKIRGFDDQTVQAIVCSEFYDIVRVSLLEEFAWKFATITDDLTLVTDETHDQYTYVYEYPEGCLKVQKVFAETDGENVTNEFDIETVFDDGVSLLRIYTDVADAKIKYTYDVQDCLAMPSPFIKALAYSLAAEIVAPLGALPFVQLVEAKKNQAVANARKLCATEQKTNLVKQNPYISARR